MKSHLLLAGLLLPLAGCGEESADKANPPLNVLVEKVAPRAWRREMTLSGSVRARVQTELSFRVSGRVIERSGEVGQHVQADAILARLDPSEQQADLDAAKAGLAGAEATLRQSAANFDRQKALLAKGYTTKAAYDLADQGQRSATGALDAARAQLSAAQDALSYTQLRAGHAGMITARAIEVGQVAQAAQSAYSFAEDGPRDAVFAVFESLFVNPPSSGSVDLSLISDPNVIAPGHIREISPVVDPRTGTIQIKVEIGGDPAQFPLGAAVSGRARWRMADSVVLPWTAMASKGGAPAIWIVDPASRRVSLRPVAIALYEKDSFVLRDGVKPGELAVTEGGKLLREGQTVRIQNEEALK